MKISMRYLLSLLWVAMSTTIFANSHLLVFKNSGEVESFEMERIISIDFSDEDSEGGIHDKPVSQRIVMNDTTIMLPIAAIDSVVFGDREIIIPYQESRRISEKELQYIKRFNGENIIYDKNTPSEYLPKKDEKIYYDGFIDIFPYGLCARVKDVVSTYDDYSVAIEEVSPKEIFKDFFVSGNFEAVPEPSLDKRGIKKSNAEARFHQESSIEVESTKVSSSVSGGIAFKNFVGNPLQDYFSSDIYLDSELLLNLLINSDDSYDSDEDAFLNGELESPSVVIPMGSIGGVVYPKLRLCLFCNVKAILSLALELKRNTSLHYRWTKRGDQNTIELVSAPSDEDNASDSSKIELVLKGAVHLGIKTDLTLNSLFNRVGVGIEGKIGPELTGELGFGMLDRMQEEYDPEYYTKSHINVALLGTINTYLYHLKNIAWGEQVKTKLPFEFEIRLLEREWQLLPEFNSRAVRMNIPMIEYLPDTPVPVVDAASTTNTNIIGGLETGYILVDNDTEQVLAMEMSTTEVLPNSNEFQGFNVKLPDNPKKENLQAYPVVNYRNRFVRGIPTIPLSGGAIFNYINTSTSNGTYLVSGSPFPGQKNTKGTTYIIGNYMPIISPNPVFAKDRVFSLISFIGADGKPEGNHSGASSIFGNWATSINGEEINMTLSPSNKTSEYNGKKASAIYNDPQPGVIKLIFEDDKLLILRIRALNSDSMNLSFNDGEKVYIFKRQ